MPFRDIATWCGSLKEVKLSNEVEENNGVVSFMYSIEIISNKLLNFMFTYIEQYIKHFLYILIISVYQATGYLIALTLSSSCYKRQCTDA